MDESIGIGEDDQAAMGLNLTTYEEVSRGFSHLLHQCCTLDHSLRWPPVYIYDLRVNNADTLSVFGLCYRDLTSLRVLLWQGIWGATLS
ncbi:MAG: hypothetical protein AB8B42_09875 [Prochlorococcus sp.]